MNRLMQLFLVALSIFVFVLPSAVSARPVFSDLTEQSSHYDSIMALYQDGIINGYPTGDGTRMFKPTESVSREHAAVMFASLLNLPQPDSQVTYYPDIPEDYRYMTAIHQVTEAGIFQGDPNGFNPLTALTREQMASVLVRAFNLTDNQQPTVAHLDNVSSSHKEAVKRLFQHDLTNQVNDFRPEEPVTRAQFASFLVRANNPQDNVLTVEEKVLTLVNQIRQEVGKPPLKLDQTLNEIALLKSEDMVAQDYFSHESPTYGSPFDMLKQFGVTYQRAGENIAYGYRTPEAVVEGWRQSEGHYLNMIGDYTHMGIGLSNEGYYWTQLFIKR